MIDDMQLRNLAASTHRQYIAYVAGFAKYFGKSPAECVFRGKPNSIPGQVEQDSGLKPNSIPG
jgi:hypothetical protein